MTDPEQGKQIPRLALTGDEQTSASPEFWMALLAAQRDAGDVPRRAYNSEQDYAYASAEDVLGVAKAALTANGLIARRSSWRLAGRGAEIGQLDEKTQLILMVFEIRHPESGGLIVETVVFPAVKTRGRPWDKAVATALTTAWHYWLRDQLQITRGLSREGDVAGRDDSQDLTPETAVLPQYGKGTLEGERFENLCALIVAGGLREQDAALVAERWLAKRGYQIGDLADGERADLIFKLAQKVTWNSCTADA